MGWILCHETATALGRRPKGRLGRTQGSSGEGGAKNLPRGGGEAVEGGVPWEPRPRDPGVCSLVPSDKETQIKREHKLKGNVVILVC